MKSNNTLPTLCLYVLLLLPVFGRAQPRLLNFSKYGPDTRMLRNQYTSWENRVPYEGLSISFLPNNLDTPGAPGMLGGRGAPGELCFSVFNPANTILDANYDSAVADMSACNFAKFKSNFMMLTLFDQNWISWSDTVNWGKMITNLGAAARIAKASGLEGIILDTEMYGGPENFNLLFYCRQFATYDLRNGSTHAFCRIDQANDNQHSIEDLFPQPAQYIYWWDPATSMANTPTGPQKLVPYYYGVFTEWADTSHFYYAILDTAKRADIAKILVDVKQRGAEILTAIKNNFPDAKIILTTGPSSIHHDFVNSLDYKVYHNYLRTHPGLGVHFLEGMLEAAQGSRIEIIDGQEQTYYHKTRNDFMKARASFDFAENYFSTATAKTLYRNNVLRAYASYARPVNSALYPAESPARFFNTTELQDQYKYATEFPDIRYVWQWEEYESIWLDNATQAHKYDGLNPRYRYGSGDSLLYIAAINKGNNALKNFVVHDNEYLYLKGTEVTGKNILVENGGTLRFRDSFTLSGAHSVTFDSGAYCCIETGLKLKLSGYHSFLNFVPGYQAGVKAGLPDNSNCMASPTTTTVTGIGMLNTIDRDVYIQNEVLTGDQYIVGKNIYIGKEVAVPTRTAGEVNINDQANIRFKAGEKVKMTTHVNVETGSTYLIQ
ncbi:hypothetical protein [Taibaiella chishuiensis]|uniref:Uncharacterized protein n=1 Tax=Taibaiella chishuiensis TaxID=1434707 RepID=A0A2P8D5N9_9BACT|nr:hypothetical protein [Taibaiella chishuiensis]PSK92535.1 hypothetical protein B0I18_103112 [Taibaiella chishuiensis]